MFAEDLAGILAEHRASIGVQCSCLWWKPSSLMLTTARFRKEHEAHVAAVIAGQMTEEARVKMQDPWVDEYGIENDGYMYVTGENGRSVEAKGRWPVEFRLVSEWKGRDVRG